MTRGCFINNEWVETALRLPVLSPWSGETLAQVSLAGEEQWEAALAVAQKAAITFKTFSSLERRQLLKKLAAGVEARQELLAQTIVAEGGKPITHARAEMVRGRSPWAWRRRRQPGSAGKSFPSIRPRPAGAVGASPGAFPWARSWVSAPLISPSTWWPTRSGRPWPRATPSSSSPPRLPRLPHSRWRKSMSKPVFSPGGCRSCPANPG